MVCTDIAYASDEKLNNDILSIKKEQEYAEEDYWGDFSFAVYNRKFFHTIFYVKN